MSHISFIKVEERYIRFLNNVTTTMSDEQMTKINFVDLEKLCNFVVEKFFIWIHLGPQKLLWNNDLSRAKKMHTAKCLFAECQKKALGKDAFCRVQKKWHLAKCLFAECQKRYSAKTYFAECQKMALGKIHLCRVQKKTLGKAIFAECRKKHSAKPSLLSAR